MDRNFGWSNFEFRSDREATGKDNFVQLLDAMTQAMMAADGLDTRTEKISDPGKGEGGWRTW